MLEDGGAWQKRRSTIDHEEVVRTPRWKRFTRRIDPRGLALARVLSTRRRVALARVP